MSQDPIKESSKPIVITGFGSIFGPAGDPNTISPNPNLSEEIMQKFYCNLGGKFVYNSEEIIILTGPGIQTEPIPCCYVKIKPFDTWLKSTCTDARIYVHLGIALNDDRTIYFEKVAYNYPVDPQTCDLIGWVADYDSHFNEDKDCIPGGDRYLTSSFNIPVLIEKVTEATKGKVDPIAVSFQESYNAGNFLCNFLYYRSLCYAKERGNANVIFIHVPEKLPQGVKMDDMVFIIEQVVRCLLDMQNEGGIEDEDANQFICPAKKPDECSNQSDINNELQNTMNRRSNRKWQYQKLTRKQARRAHRRRKRKWRLRQRKHIK